MFVTQTNHYYIASMSLKLVQSEVTKHSNYTLSFTSKLIIYLNECTLSKVHYVEKAKTAFKIRINDLER